MPDRVMKQIKNIVFLMLENRSLDNVLGWLYSPKDRPLHVYPKDSSPLYDGLLENHFFVPVPGSYFFDEKQIAVSQVPVSHDRPWEGADRIPFFNPHEAFRTDGWKGVMNQLFGDQNEISGLPATGTPCRMRGFLQDYHAWYMELYGGVDILWTFAPTDLPVINGLARKFAVSDAWFSSVPSQTNPNRAFSLCGTSVGRVSNLSWNAKEKYYVPTVINYLSEAGKTWGLYFSDDWDWPWNKSYTEYTFPMIEVARHENPENAEVADIDQFFVHAKDGTLPHFTYLEPEWGYGKGGLEGGLWFQGTDFHPPTSVTPGDQFLRKVYQAVRESPQWNQMLFIVTFDEHGGTYDHVAPKSTINPDRNIGESGFKFDLLGVRVPTILISPYIQPSTVFRAPNPASYPFDHTSFIKTLLLWAGIDPSNVKLGKRMPLAPTFEGVLQDQPCNDGTLSFEAPRAALAAAEPVEGTDRIPPAGAGQELNTLFEGVSFPAIRAILHKAERIAEVEAEIARYKADPEGFVAGLESGEG